MEAGGLLSNTWEGEKAEDQPLCEAKNVLACVEQLGKPLSTLTGRGGGCTE